MLIKDIKWRQCFCGAIIMLLYTLTYAILHLFSKNIISAALLCILCILVIPIYAFVTRKIGNAKSFDFGIISVSILSVITTVIIMLTWAELPLAQYIWYGDSLKVFLKLSPSFLNWYTAIVYTKLLKRVKSEATGYIRNAGIMYSVIIFIPVLFMILEASAKLDDLGMWATLIMMAIAVVFYLIFMFKEGDDRTFSLTVIAFIIAFTVPATIHLSSFTTGWGGVFYLIYMPIVVLGLIVLDNALWLINRVKKRK